MDSNKSSSTFEPTPYSITVLNDVKQRIIQVQTEYENLMNEKRQHLNDGKGHNRFSCRIKDNGLSIPLCFRFMLVMKGSDLHEELNSCFLFHDRDVPPSESAFCQVRNKIPLESFVNFFYWTVEEYYWSKFPPGSITLRILAVDGTEHSYPANDEETDNYIKTRSETRARNVIHINACVDTERNMIIEVIPQNGHDKDEREAHYEIMKRVARRIPNLDQRRSCLFTTDRGYEAWNLPVLADSLNFSFLCRIKSEDSNGILSGIKDILPSSRNSYDRVITITLTRDSSKKNLSGYHYLNPNTICELVTRDKEYTITLRITKIRISDTVTEYLFSNLPKDIYSKECLMELYHRRWPCETSFNYLKYALCLSAPHASTCEPETKEMWCRMSMFNICSTIAFHDGYLVARKEDTGKKYDDVRNFTNCVSDIRRFFSIDREYDLDAVIQKEIRPDRPKDSTPRNKQPRSTPSFGHRFG